MKYVCTACGFVYDEDAGDPENGGHDRAGDAENVGTVGGKIGPHDAERQIVGGVTDRIADIVFCRKFVSHFSFLF